MIVSASYRSDIPACYGEWFMARLDAGFCRVINPWGGAHYTVPLDRASVTGFVFWTRNARPFLSRLDDVAARGYPFVVQHSLTGYPRALERAVSAEDAALDTMRALAARFGPKALVWRYDPVVESSLTPLEDHRERFGRLAATLEGSCDEVVISFVHAYRKTRRNLDDAARRQGFQWRESSLEAKRALAAELAETASRHGMELTVCAQPEVAAAGTAPARCVDAGRLAEIAGAPLIAKEKGNRPGCLCHESRDIGAYESCPQGCVYCYAVAESRRASQARRAHDPAGEFLIPPGSPAAGGRRGSKLRSPRRHGEA